MAKRKQAVGSPDGEIGATTGEEVHVDSPSKKAMKEMKGMKSAGSTADADGSRPMKAMKSASWKADGAGDIRAMKAMKSAARKSRGCWSWSLYEAHEEVHEVCRL